MFMEWKIQSYEDDINLQIPLQIQCNLLKISINCPSFCMKV